MVSDVPTDDPPARSALWGRRLVALVIDWTACLLIARTLLPYEGSFVPLAVFAAEQVVLVGTIGFSLGHRLLGLRVERPGGGPAGPVAALVRTALLLLVIPAVLTDGEGVGLHDRAAGTRIIRR